MDVTLTDTDDDTNVITGKTGSAGGCTLQNVKVGSYTVLAELTGYDDYTGNLTVTEETTTLSIEMSETEVTPGG